MNEIYSFETFLCELKKTLRHLYDPAELRKNPLLPLLTDEKGVDPISSLRRILVDSIQKLNPGPRASFQSNSVRIYNALSYRYIEQTPSKAVANSLGISVRQLQRLILEAELILADKLWSQYNLESKLESRGSLPITSGDEIEQIEDETPKREQELQWLQESFPSEVINLAEVIGNLRRTIKPLTQSLNVQTEWNLEGNLPPVTGQVAPLRQALLNLVIACVSSVPGGLIKVKIGTESQGIRIAMQAIRNLKSSTDVTRDVSENLLMARQFVGMLNGKFDVQLSTDEDWALTSAVLLPLADQLPVLVLDDNADTLLLIQRYLTGTRYRFLGTHNYEHAMELIRSQPPKVIVLDVMLPGIDDWEMLGRLREHLITRETPIIICTILPLEELAMSLGADGFIRKPVNRKVLLAELDRQTSFPLKG